MENVFSPSKLEYTDMGDIILNSLVSKSQPHVKWIVTLNTKYNGLDLSIVQLSPH